MVKPRQSGMTQRHHRGEAAHDKAGKAEDSQGASQQAMATARFCPFHSMQDSCPWQE